MLNQIKGNITRELTESMNRENKCGVAHLCKKDGTNLAVPQNEYHFLSIV